MEKKYILGQKGIPKANVPKKSLFNLLYNINNYKQFIFKDSPT